MSFLQALAFSSTIVALAATAIVPVVVVAALGLSFFWGAIIIGAWGVLFFAVLIWALPLIEGFLQ